ncbi:MAG: cobalamin B12-binding domain-containing protein, partial [Alphaproteobacteria bacterium]|nr:cobalamin B12-binding domain-containing protein [Alphaproteobacteria bacterium]
MLLSTYDLGHQPFGLASPAAWLERAGLDVTCNDLAVEALDEAAAISADLIALYIPMHTATRMAAELLPRLRTMNPAAHINCYGLYGPVNSNYLKSLGADSVVGGEFEGPLVDLARGLLAG